MAQKLKKSFLKWSLLVIGGFAAYLLGNYFGQKQHLIQSTRVQQQVAQQMPEDKPVIIE